MLFDHNRWKIIHVEYCYYTNVWNKTLATHFLPNTCTLLQLRNQIIMWQQCTANIMQIQDMKEMKEKCDICYIDHECWVKQHGVKNKHTKKNINWKTFLWVEMPYFKERSEENSQIGSSRQEGYSNLNNHCLQLGWPKKHLSMHKTSTLRWMNYNSRRPHWVLHLAQTHLNRTVKHQNVTNMSIVQYDWNSCIVSWYISRHPFLKRLFFVIWGWNWLMLNVLKIILLYTQC